MNTKLLGEIMKQASKYSDNKKNNRTQILSAVKIDISDSHITFTTTKLEKWFVCDTYIPINEEYHIAVNAKVLSDLLAHFDLEVTTQLKVRGSIMYFEPEATKIGEEIKEWKVIKVKSSAIK